VKYPPLFSYLNEYRLIWQEESKEALANNCAKLNEVLGG
jgi:hypothetical protein